MRFLFFVCLIILPAWNVYAHQEIDSLLASLQRPQLADSSRIDIFNELAFLYAGVNPDSGLLYADSAFLLSRKYSLTSREATALNNKGVNFWYQGKDSLALNAYQSAYNIFHKLKNLKKQAIALNNMALISYNREDFKKALEYHEQASEIFRNLGLTKNLTNSLSNTGVVFLALSDYPAALEYFLKAYSQTQDEDVSIRAQLNTNLGLVSKNLGDLQEAKRYHEEAILLYRRIGHRQEEANGLANLANVYQLTEDYRQADSLFSLSLSIQQSIGNKRRIASDLTNRGILYKSWNKKNEALNSLQEARTLYTELGDRSNLSLVLLELAEVEQLNGPAKARWPRVLGLQKEALSLAQGGALILRQQAAWLALSNTYNYLGRYDKALEAFKYSSAFKDSIFNDENEKKMLRLQVEFDVQTKNAAVLAQNELEKQRLRADKEQASFRARIYLLLSILLMVLIFAGIYLVKKRNQARQAVFRSNIAALELKSLRAQMDPHFIFNSLNSISNFLLENQPEQADYYLSKFAQMIRMILKFSDQKLISLSEEKALLEDYVSIEQMRLNKEVQLIWDLDEDISMDTEIPPMLLQPLVENSIWHGISYISGAGKIELRFERQSGMLHIRLRDNGPGMQSDKNTGKMYESRAMRIVTERLQLLSKRNSPPAENVLRWKNLDNGFQIDIFLPDFSSD